MPFVDEDEVVAFEDRRADRVWPWLSLELRDLDDVDVGLPKREAQLRPLLEHASPHTGLLHLPDVLAPKPSIRRDQQHVVRRRLAVAFQRSLVLEEVR